MWKYIEVMFKSLPMFILLLIFVVHFAWLLNRMLSGTVAGVQNFDSVDNAFFEMMQLLTSANSPDIMMPAYQANPFNCLYFIVFIIFMMFILRSFLIAIVYHKFKSRINNKLDRKKYERQQFLKEKFDQFVDNRDNLDSKKTKATLDMIGMYKFFIMIHSVVNNKN